MRLVTEVQPWNPRGSIDEGSRIERGWIGGGGGVEEGEGWPPLHPRGQCPLLSSDEITIMD